MKCLIVSTGCQSNKLPFFFLRNGRTPLIKKHKTRFWCWSCTPDKRREEKKTPTQCLRFLLFISSFHVFLAFSLESIIVSNEMFTFNQHGSTNINSMFWNCKRRKKNYSKKRTTTTTTLNTVFCHSLFAWKSFDWQAFWEVRAEPMKSSTVLNIHQRCFFSFINLHFSRRRQQADQRHTRAWNSEQYFNEIATKLKCEPMTHNVNTAAHWAIIQFAMKPIRDVGQLFVFIASDGAIDFLKGNQIIRFELNELLCFFFLFSCGSPLNAD